MKKILTNKNLLLPLLSSIVFIVCLLTLVNKPADVQAQSSGSVTFGAAGDFGGSSNAEAVLTAVKNGNLNFFVHLGDFSYDEQGGPSGWPTWVKGIVGSSLPYEIITGNHDDCCIDQYVTGLPNKISTMQGDYGKQYYFDYPVTNPLMRVILVAPSSPYEPDQNWIASSIDSARSKGIPWVIVGMHKNCITTGHKTCEITESFMNMLISKKVDLILQGHEHTYQRTKQLTCVKENTTDQSCISNAGPNYPKGAGSVLVISAAGGNGLYDTSSSDPEAGYFAIFNSDTYGYTKFTVSATQLSGQFVRAAGGNLSDSFTITGSSTVTPGSGVTPTGITPTFQCLSGSPCTSPNPTATTGPSNPVTSTNPNPSTNPSVNPCISAGTNSIADHHHKHHHKKRGNRGGGYLSQFMAQLFQLIMELLKKLGIEVPDGTFPGVTPSVTPSVSPSGQPAPSTNPCPSTTP